MDVQILGISADNPFSQRTFADSLQLPYPLLSDHPDLQVIRGYGILSSSQKTAQRAFFLIDKEGVVRGRWLVENTEILPSEPILQVVREIAGQS